MMIKTALTNITLALSVLASVIEALVSIGYVLITFSSVYGLILAIIMALADMIVSSIILYATLHSNDPENQTNNTKQSSSFPSQNKSTIFSNIFLIIAIPSIFINAASIYVGGYQSFLLLSASLTLNILSPAIAVGVAIFIGIVFSLGSFLYASLLTYDLWNELLIARPQAEKSITNKKFQNQLGIKLAPIYEININEKQYTRIFADAKDFKRNLSSDNQKMPEAKELVPFSRII